VKRIGEEKSPLTLFDKEGNRKHSSGTGKCLNGTAEIKGEHVRLKAVFPL
jgi:hypothetical protein